MPEETATLASRIVYRVVRYIPNLVRGEWVNVGVLVFDLESGERRLRLIEGQDEYNRVRRLHPQADESVLRDMQQLESWFDLPPKSSSETRDGIATQNALAAWDKMLSNNLQFAPPKGIENAENLDHELDRLYAHHVALQPRGTRIGLPGSRSTIRSYCAQVFQKGRLWDHLEKSVRVADFTFPGDPMRLDFGYRRNGTRGFVHALSATRSPGDAKVLAYTAKRIQEKAYFASEFAAVTDVALDRNNERHRFIGDTLRDAGIESIAMEAFATWVPKLRAMLQ